MQSPQRQLQAKLYIQDHQLRYTVTAKQKTIIEPSILGIEANNIQYGKNVTSLQLIQQGQLSAKQTSRLNSSSFNIQYQSYTVNINHQFNIEFRLFDNGCAFRYVMNDVQDRIVNNEQTSFTVPVAARVWFFERENAWKLKSYAGWWTNTTIDSLPITSRSGPIQGKPLVIALPDKTYTVITEAALNNYSGMRLKAVSNRAVQVNFTEGDKGFAVKGKLATPWRVILFVSNLNELVNNHVIESLNPQPDKTLFANTGYIQPGKAVWSWITRNGNYMQPQEEKNFIDAASTLHFQYTLLDEGWETIWTDKWQQLQELVQYAAAKNIRVWVWKDSKWLRDTISRNAFMDTLAAVGVAGIKTDFMNSEAKELIDFETGFLQAAAARKLMVNFHGCQAPTGESVTYPNEMTREGIRGMELNIMKEPIPAWHNAALPFTRFLCGHGDYTPGLFSNKGNTTYTHQLALLYLFNSPFLCMAENPTTIVSDKKYAPIIPLLQTLPVTWDETIVLPQSNIGELAAFARRKGNDWYIAVINGTNTAKAFRFNPVYLNKAITYKALITTDAVNDDGFQQQTINSTHTTDQSFTLQPSGGLVIQLKKA